MEQDFSTFQSTKKTGNMDSAVATSAIMSFNFRLNFLYKAISIT